MPTVPSTFAPSKPLSPLQETTQETQNIDLSKQSNQSTPIVSDRVSQQNLPSPAEPAPLNAIKSDNGVNVNSNVARSSAANDGFGRFGDPNKDNQVLNDTLNVIDEHITHLRSAPSNSALSTMRTGDSGSDYSALDRMSYIQGEETDEEEEMESDFHTRDEVASWTVDQVAEYLRSVGVEQQHYEVFREQEISGEVLLGMDQSSLFIKAFDLGSVGRRLKTWHKIKALQDETTGFGGVATRRTTQTYGSEVGSEDYRRSRGRTNTLTTVSTSGHRPSSIHNRRMSSNNKTPASIAGSFMSQGGGMDNPNRGSHYSHTKGHSAASARDIANSRRHSSSTEYRVGGNSPGPATPRLTATGTYPLENPHKKQPSFDREWSLGGAFSQTGSDTYSMPPRPLSSGMQDSAAGSEAELQDSAVDLDRGYFSGTETGAKKRNVLKKQNTTSNRHTNSTSYADEQRTRSAALISKHSRFGSDVSQGSAAHKYYSSSVVPHRRTASTNTQESYRPPPPAKDSIPSPTVTKLDGDSASASPSTAKHWFSNVVQKPIGKASGGMRAISDGLGLDRKAKTLVDAGSSKFSINSPTRTDSSVPSIPSGAPSLELDSQGDHANSPDASAAATLSAAAQAKKMSKRTKKDTSAYTKGLLKIPPSVAMKDAEYSGWMRKKSSNLMTTWKPRFFVLSGRRLAYYYSEDDVAEKGLIDISFHRVLPADNERLTGLHATISGVVDRPSGAVPQDLQKGDDSMFIFKLVPPRAGLNKAVNFTKPTIHYFAVPNLKQGRLWMAALMKATIDRDDSQPLTTTYQQKTISLAKARQMRHRPPALMNLEETKEDDPTGGASKQQHAKKDSNGLGIFGETDSGVSGVDKLASRMESSSLDLDGPGSTPTPST